MSHRLTHVSTIVRCWRLVFQPIEILEMFCDQLKDMNGDEISVVGSLVRTTVQQKYTRQASLRNCFSNFQYCKSFNTLLTSRLSKHKTCLCFKNNNIFRYSFVLNIFASQLHSIGLVRERKNLLQYFLYFLKNKSLL